MYTKSLLKVSLQQPHLFPSFPENTVDNSLHVAFIISVVAGAVRTNILAAPVSRQHLMERKRTIQINKKLTQSCREVDYERHIRVRHIDSSSCR